MQKLSILMLGLALALVPAAAAAQANVSGDWEMMFQTDQGDLPASLSLEQDGETISGELISDQGVVEFEGTIMGNTVNWVIEVDAGGAMLEITMEGTVAGDEITGTADFGGYGGGAWTATRE